MATGEKKKADEKGPAPAEQKKVALSTENEELDGDQLDKVSGGAGNPRIRTLNTQTQDET